MTTKQHREAAAAIQAWIKKQKDLVLEGKLRHVHPRAYVIGHAAPGCLIVTRCWADSEPHQRDWDRQYPLQSIHMFDRSLKAGDWCMTAYGCFKHRGGWPVAVPIPQDTEKQKPRKK